jgi:hypothetical protein
MDTIKLSKTKTRVRSSAITYSPEIFGDINIVKKFKSFNNLSPDDYTSLIHLFNDACCQNIVNERSGVILPSDVGTIQVIGIKYKKKFNYKSKKTENLNIHTDGYLFKIIKRHYTQVHKKRNGTLSFKLYKNGNSYKFKTSTLLRRLLYHKIKSGNFGHFLKLDQLNAND